MDILKLKSTITNEIFATEGSTVVSSWYKRCNLRNREKKMKKDEQRVRKIWGITKYINICIMGILPKRRTQKVQKKILKQIIAENLSYLMRNINLHTQEIQLILSKVNTEIIPRDIILKC